MWDQGLGNSLGSGVTEVCVSFVWLELSCVFGDLGTASGIGCLKCVSAVGLGTASATGCLKCVSCGARNSLSDWVLEVCVSCGA